MYTTSPHVLVFALAVPLFSLLVKPLENFSHGFIRAIMVKQAFVRIIVSSESKVGTNIN
jgi:hypothetical protein